MNKFAQKAAGVAALATLGTSAFAVGPSAGDLSTLTPDSATILTAVGAVAVVMIGVKLAIVGYRIVKGLINR